MYKEFYGLNDEPFKIAPDPKFFYPSEKHNEALTYLLYGIERKKGLIVLTGEIGSGKTILLKTLVHRLDAKSHIASLVNFQVASDDIFKSLCHEFDLETGTNETHIDLLNALKNFLEQCIDTNEDCILMIDEAQSLPDDVLEQLRLLSNFETHEEKLIQIILVGHRELHDKLNLPEFAKLKQRIGVSYELLPLNYSETESYIEKRLTVAGAATSPFTPAAIEEIYRYSKGIPRVINIMCDLALFIGFGDKQREIGRALIVQAAETLHLYKSEERSDQGVVKMPNGSRVEAVAGPSLQARGERRGDFPTMSDFPTVSDFPMRSGYADKEVQPEGRTGWRGFRRLVYVGMAGGVVFGLVFGGGLLRISEFVLANQEKFSQWPWTVAKQASEPETLSSFVSETPSEPQQPEDSPYPTQTTPPSQTTALKPTTETRQPSQTAPPTEPMVPGSTAETPRPSPTLSSQAITPRPTAETPRPMPTASPTQTAALKPAAEAPWTTQTPPLPPQPVASEPAMDDHMLSGPESTEQDNPTVDDRATDTSTTSSDVVMESTMLPSEGLLSTDDIAASNIQGSFNGGKIVEVNAGDTLGEIILTAYGKVSPNLILLVQEANPDVTNPSRIEIGQRLILPLLPK